MSALTLSLARPARAALVLLVLLAALLLAFALQFAVHASAAAPAHAGAGYQHLSAYDDPPPGHYAMRHPEFWRCALVNTAGDAGSQRDHTSAETSG